MARKTCTMTLISVSNIFLILLAIIICCLSLNDWNDYLTCTLTIILALSWSCCLFVRSNLPYSIYAGLMILNLLLLLANAIYHTVMNVKYSDFCFNNNLNSFAPTWGCNDWRNGGHYQRSIGIIVCYFLGFLFQLLNIVGACLIAREFYEDGY